jgi:hypothetical protein
MVTQHGRVFARPANRQATLDYQILCDLIRAKTRQVDAPDAVQAVQVSDRERQLVIGLLRADPTSYLSVYPKFAPFLGTDLTLGPTPDTSITGSRSYTRANFLYYAGVVQPGIYR